MPPDPFATPDQPWSPAPPSYGQPAAQPTGQPLYGAPTGWQGPPLASWGSRVGSGLIDVGVSAVPYIVGAALGAAVGGTGGVLLLVLGYLTGFAIAMWNYVVQGRTGQSVGKRVLGTRLLREQDGQVVGAGLSIGRSFLHIVDGLSCYIGYLWPIWDAKKQTFADKIVKTVVVKV